MILVDTNVLLEILLRQGKLDIAKTFLDSTSPEKLYLTEFSLHSIGIILFQKKMEDAFLRLLNDLLIEGGIRLIQLSIGDMPDLVLIAKRFELDFDDAYQYTAAQKYNLTIVCFDHDFDRTDRGRRTPAEMINELSP